jgi:Uncharacterized conserved protein
MVLFRPITVGDKEIITNYTLKSNFKNCDFSFSNMCSWRFLYDSEYAIIDGFLIIRFWIEEKSRLVYMYPIGVGDTVKVIRMIEEDSIANGHPLLLLGVTNDTREEIDKVFGKEFVYIKERNYFDYIYRREDLVTLTGKKYQSKRNHINKFINRYTYEYKTLTGELVSQCLELGEKWYNTNKTDEDRKALGNEQRSMKYALEHFNELGITGGAILVDGNIIAFTYGSPINGETFGVHVEKADINYEGAYAIINKEFASRIPEQYEYINREEDLGIPGLRKSKMSYNPVIILEKYAAVKKYDKQENH